MHDPARCSVSSDNLRSIDALRGWAILLVIAVHVSFLARPESPVWRQIIQHGRMGVVLFFCVSALTLWLAQDRHRSEQSPVRNFFIRRVFRIAPMFYLGIVASLMISGFSPHPSAPAGITPVDVLLTLTLLHGFLPDTVNAVVPGGWSIAAEMIFYACFPLLVRYVTRPARLVMTLLIAILIAAALASSLPPLLGEMYPPPWRYAIENYFDVWFPNHFPDFLIGIGLAMIVRQHPPKTDRVLAIGLLLLAGTLIFSLMFMNLGNRLINSNHYFALAFSLIALSLYHWENPLMVNPFTVFIGKISFSLYLTHILLIQAIFVGGLSWPTMEGSPGLLYLKHFALVATASIAMSVLTYFLIEKPGIAVGRRLIRQLEKI